jgi:hypothetical protein
VADLKRVFDGLDQLEAAVSWSDVKRRSPSPPLGQPERPRRLLAIGLAFAVAAAGISFALRAFVFAPDRPAAPSPISPGSLVRIPVGSAPQPIAADDVAAWVVTGTSQTGNVLWRIDARTDHATELPATRGAGWPAVGEGFAWVTCTGAQNPCGGNSVLKLDRATGTTLATIKLPDHPFQIATGLGNVWVSAGSALVKIDSVAAKVVATFPIHTNLLGTGDGSVWATVAGGVVQIDPTDGRGLNELGFPDPCTLLATNEGVWVSSCGGGVPPGSPGDELMRIDPATGRVMFRLPVENGGGSLTFAEERVWLARSVGDHVEIEARDPMTGKPTGTVLRVKPGPRPWLTIGPGPGEVFMAVGAGSFWLTHVDSGDVVRLGIRSGRVPEVEAVAPSACPQSGVPGTEVDLTTLAHKTQFENTCYTVLANVPFLIVFVNNTTALSGKPLSLGISLYHSPDEGYTVTDNGDAFVSHPDKAIFKGDEVLAPGSTVYKLPALPAGSYWIQSDPIAPIMNAWLVVQNPGP